MTSKLKLPPDLTLAQQSATPFTLRAYCQQCQRTRLLRCLRVAIYGGNNVVETTCLTCNTKVRG